MKFFMYIFSAIRLITCLAFVVLFLLYYYTSLLVRKHSQEKVFNLRRNWTIIISWILGIKIELEGNIPEKPVLLVCNHRSMMDPLILARYIQAYIIAKAEVFRYPLIGAGAKITGVIFVKREKRKSRKATREAMVETLKAGENVLVFPEGTTGIRNKTLAFRIGAFEELAVLGLPVVPIAMDYKNKVDLWLTPNMAIQMLKQFAKWRTYVKIKIGDPIISDDAMELHNMSKDYINKELKNIQENWHEVFG